MATTIMRHTARLCAAFILATFSVAPWPLPLSADADITISLAQRGGGRGRGAIATIALSTAAWPDGGQIPPDHSQAGGDKSPPLTWTNVPEGIASFVLIVHDLDAPTGSGIDDRLHWLVWNIPGSLRELRAGVPQGATLPDGSRQISVTGPNYRGPAASASAPVHHIVFELYALDVMLDVPAVGAPPAEARAAVVTAMSGHVRGKGVYTGVFRQAP